MEGPVASQYRWSGVCWPGSVAVASAIGGLELAGPSPSRSEKGVAVKRFAVVAGVAMARVRAGFVPARPAQAATSTKVVRYGPFTIPAGTATDPGMIHN